MLLRSGRDTSLPGPPLRRSGGSTSRCSSDEAASRLRLKRKSSVQVEDAPTRRVRSKSPPASPCKQPIAPVPLHPPPEVGVGVYGVNNGDDSYDEASIAEYGVKLFPHLSPRDAAALWVGFVKDARTCIRHYNNKHQANFVYKNARGNGFYRIEEKDDSCWYHMNFQAQDKNGHSQLFFAEIKECVVPQVEDVTCCCPVSPSDVGGKGIRTIEEAVKHVFPDWHNVGVDEDHCYACTSMVKHPKGTSYVAGHVADSRRYYAFWN